MTRPGIEPRSPGPLANTQPTWPVQIEEIFYEEFYLKFSRRFFSGLDIKGYQKSNHYFHLELSLNLYFMGFGKISRDVMVKVLENYQVSFSLQYFSPNPHRLKPYSIESQPFLELFLTFTFFFEGVIVG